MNSQNKTASTTNSKNSDCKSDNPLPPELEHCDKALVEKIEAEIVHTGQVVTFEEIAGLEFAKKCVNELICWWEKTAHFSGVLCYGVLRDYS